MIRVPYITLMLALGFIACEDDKSPTAEVSEETASSEILSLETDIACEPEP